MNTDIFKNDNVSDHAVETDTSLGNDFSVEGEDANHIDLGSGDIGAIEEDEPINDSNNYEDPEEDPFSELDDFYDDAEEFMSDDDELEKHRAKYYPEEDEEKEEDTSDAQGSQSESEELAALNKILGKDFKSLEEAKNLFGEKQEELVVTEEEKQTLSENQSRISFLSDVMKLDDRSLLEKHYQQIAMQKNKGVLSDEDKEEIENKLYTFENSGNLELHARNLRNDIKDHIGGLKSKSDAINNKIESHRKEQERAQVERIQDSFRDIYKGKDNFYGVKLTEKDIQDSYSKVKSGDFIKEIQNNPKIASELALMMAKRKDIQKASSRPSYDEGVRAVMQEVEGRPQSRQNRVSSQVSQKGQRSRAMNHPDPLINGLLS